MGRFMDIIKARREEAKERKKASQQMRKEALEEARKEYKTAYIQGAKQAVKARAKREATARFGSSPAERRKKALSNFTKELGSLGEWGTGNLKTTSKHKKVSHHTVHTKPKKMRNPFDLGDLDNFDMGDMF